MYILYAKKKIKEKEIKINGRVLKITVVEQAKNVAIVRNHFLCRPYVKNKLSCSYLLLSLQGQDIMKWTGKPWLQNKYFCISAKKCTALVKYNAC